MSLQDQLLEDMKQAMKAKATEKLGVIRFLRAELKNYEIDNGSLTDEDVQKVIAKMIKQMQDAMADFKSAGRDDLVSEEEAKIAILQSYLPEQLSDEELASIVQSVVESNPDLDRGPVIGKVKAEVGNKADGKRVAAAVAAYFAGK